MDMKKKIFMLLAMVMTVMTASAVDAPSFSLTKADGAEAHGQISFIVGENQNATTAKEGETVTVVLTPDQGWDLGTASGRWYAAMAKAPRRAGDIDLLDNLTLTPANKNTWTFTMQRANAEVNFTYKKLMDNEDITVTIGDATYTGQPLTPTVTVKDGNTVLTEGTVYTLSYSNNTDAGLSTAGDKAPSVTITAKSSDDLYAGSVTKTFTIQKAAATISYETTAVNKTFGDADFSNELSMSGDGSVTYESDNEKVATVDAETGLVHIVAAGSANIIAKVADGANYTYVTKEDQYAVTVSKAAATISYETASISKTYGDEDFTNPLTMTGDGSVTYSSDNESVATVNSESGLVHIVGSGNANITATVVDGKNFTYAVKTAQYAIGVNTAAMTVSAEGYTGTYDGQSHTITVTVTEPEGTTVKYGTKAGEYTMDEAPAYTDAGEYTVFYQVTKENYTTVVASAIVTIQKAAATISYETGSVIKNFGDADFINALTVTGDGSVTYASDNENVATVDSETGEVTIKKLGNANIIATVVDGKNYTYAVKTAQYALTVEGYAVIVPAGEYVTYFDSESALKLATEGAELYTITAVENGEAVLSNPSDVMPKNTPFLMKNNTNEEKTFVLVTCNDPDLAITVADEFIGTLTAKEFTEDDMATAEFYVCNGLEFIKVRGAGRLAPKKAYLKVNGNNAPLSIPFRRSIGGEGEGTTSIDASLVNSEEVNSVWYDLNGRRLQGKPSLKGIYIKNGKKVVVH